MTKTLQAKMDELLRLNELVKQAELEYEKELEKEENWHLTKYPLVIEDYQIRTDRLSIECNYKSYQATKKDKAKDVFYLEVGEECGLIEAGISLTLDTAKQLSDYILKVIDYMEDK